MTDRRIGADEVELIRIISAPAAEVHRAFLYPDRLRHWFGPGGFVVLDSTIDARIGGAHVTLREAAPGSSPTCMRMSEPP